MAIIQPEIKWTHLQSNHSRHQWSERYEAVAQFSSIARLANFREPGVVLIYCIHWKLFLERKYYMAWFKCLWIITSMWATKSGKRLRLPVLGNRWHSHTSQTHKKASPTKIWSTTLTEFIRVNSWALYNYIIQYKYQLSKFQYFIEAESFSS